MSSYIHVRSLKYSLKMIGYSNLNTQWFYGWILLQNNLCNLWIIYLLDSASRYGSCGMTVVLCGSGRNYRGFMRFERNDKDLKCSLYRMIISCSSAKANTPEDVLVFTLKRDYYNYNEKMRKIRN